jgi:BCD family chlorophyll transporter-like MFS transporter
MQDVLLEPYGGEILGLSVSATTFLTALLAIGTLAGFGLAAKYLANGGDAYRLAALGAVIGIPGFSAVIFSAPLGSADVFRAGTLLIGLGSGLFAVGALTAAMALADGDNAGMALGVWGAVQASAAGGGIALGGIIRDGVQSLAGTGALGTAFMRPDIGYSIVYHLEILLLFLTLIVIGPLATFRGSHTAQPQAKFGLPEFPN